MFRRTREPARSTTSSSAARAIPTATVPMWQMKSMIGNGETPSIDGRPK